MTKQEVFDEFREFIRPLVVKRYGENDVIAINEEFNNWTDSLCKEGCITTELYNTITWIEDD